MLTPQRVRKAIGKQVSRARLRAVTKLGAEARRFCPACGKDVVGFFRYGSNVNWGCPECGASPRERLMHTLLDNGDLVVPAGATVLHCAPSEKRLAMRLSSPASQYVPADIAPERYDLPDVRELDLMTLQADSQYDRIYASHVMEHVPNDAIVLKNIRQALKIGGEVWLLVPLWHKPTEDGPPNLDPRERERRYGQWDHVRQYGLDFADRIRAAGLSVEVIDSADMPSHDVQKMGLGDCVFRGTRDD